MKTKKYIPQVNDYFNIDNQDDIMKCIAVNHKGVAFEIISSNDESDIGVYDSVPLSKDFQPAVSPAVNEQIEHELTYQPTQFAGRCERVKGITRDNITELDNYGCCASPLSSLANRGWRVEPGQFKINPGELISVDEVDKKIASAFSNTQSQIVALRDSLKLTDIRLSRVMQDIKYLFEPINLQSEPYNDLINAPDKKPTDKYIPEIGHFFTVSHIGKYIVPIFYECTGVSVSLNMPEFTQRKEITGKSLMRDYEDKITDSDEVIFIRLNKDGSEWEE